MVLSHAASPFIVNGHSLNAGPLRNGVTDFTAKTITGTVTDSKGTPLQGVTVLQ